jgi:HEAT repeat protein
LKDPKKEVRQSTIRVLGTVKANTPEVIAKLLGQLYDSNREIQQSVVQALGAIKANTPEVVSKLLVRLKEDLGTDVQVEVIRALGEMEANTLEVLASLMLRLDNPNGQIQQAAAQALGTIGINTTEVIDALMAYLNNPKVEIRRVVARSLGKLGVNMPEVLNELKEQVSHHNDLIGSEAALILANLGDFSGIPTLIGDLKLFAPEYRPKAIEVLGEIDMPEVVLELKPLLEHHFASVRRNAVEVLQLMTIPEAQKALDDAKARDVWLPGLK